MRDRRAPPSTDAHPRGRAGRVRYTLALFAVVAALLAVSAMLKRETCGCSGPGVPYSTIAIAAGATGAISLILYLAAEMAAYRR